MSTKKRITYTGLLDTYYPVRKTESPEATKLFRQAGAIPQGLLSFKGIIHVIDYTQRRHIGIRGPIKNIVGYDAKHIMEGGLDFVIDIFQKDDFKIYNETIFGQVVAFLKSIPQKEHSEYVFTYSYRMKRADGKSINLYQQCSYITDPCTKLPLYGTGLVTDITPMRKDSRMIFSIDKKESNLGSSNYTNVLTNFYYPDPDESRLTTREREILSRLAEGLSSKQIADKLFLSESTIANHRKNILKKTNTRNVAGLISHAISKGII